MDEFEKLKNQIDSLSYELQKFNEEFNIKLTDARNAIKKQSEDFIKCLDNDLANKQQQLNEHPSLTVVKKNVF